MTMSKSALEGASRGDFFRIKYKDPAVKVEVIDNPEHPEYDPRVALPVNMDLVWSIRIHGQLNAGTGYKLREPDEMGRTRVILDSGRQRLKAMQKIWEEDLAAGVDPKDLPTFKITLHPEGRPTDRVEISIVENEHRVQDEPIERARKIRRYLDQVGDDEFIRERVLKLFGVPSKAMLENILKLLDLTPKAQAAVTAGEITPTLGTDISRLPAEQQDKVVEQIKEAPTRPTVKEGKEMIREMTGAAPKFEMVNLRLLEKRLEKVAVDLDKAMTKFEDSTDSTKTGDLAARVAKLQGWDEALRWTRGETTASGAGSVSQGNDPMSAAWAALMDALTQAEWPRILQRYQAGFPAWEPERRGEPEYETRYRAQEQEAVLRMRMSHVLVVAGELVAERHVAANGVTKMLYVNTDTKWFTRLMDPHGSPTRLVRDWGAHGWLEPMGKRGGIPSYKSKVGYLGADWNRIQIQPKALEKAIAGTPLGTPYSVEEQVLEIIREKVEGDAWSRVARSSCFGTPWRTEGDDEGTIGPDLGDNDGFREDLVDDCREILNDCVESCEGFSIPPEDRTWQTVGDLVDYVVRRVEEIRAQAAETATAAPAEEPAPAPAGDDQGDEAGQDGDA
jgi:ParB-like chromosome segregation protein Spo0J